MYPKIRTSSLGQRVRADTVCVLCAEPGGVPGGAGRAPGAGGQGVCREEEGGHVRGGEDEAGGGCHHTAHIRGRGRWGTRRGPGH